MDGMERIGCLLVGYICGCFLTAELISKKYTGHGVEENGPDNPGMAGITRKLGKKAGFLVLFGDGLKTFIAIGICRLWLFRDLGSLAVSYAGFGAVLGHSFPIFRHFHGGKGIAVTGVYSLCLYPPVFLITYISGGLAALLTRQLAVGSAVIAVLFPVTTFFFGFKGEEIILAMIAGSVILIRHKRNFHDLFRQRAISR